MKKIINNKVYDTDTAKQIGAWDNGAGYSDFNYMEETLYQKRTGEFFIHGVGGPMTKYAVSCGNNSWSGGEKIIPLTYENAQKWAEEHLDADDYISIFGDPGEGDDSKEPIYAMLPAPIVIKLKSKAAQEGMSVTAYLAKVLKELV